MEFENGIELLNSIEIMKPQNIFLLITYVLLFLLGVILFISGLCYTFYKSKLKYLSISVIGIILLIVPIQLTEYEQPTGKYEYQITIDDSVSFNKFMNKYEIIEKQGKIYTVRLREEEDESKSKETNR